MINEFKLEAAEARAMQLAEWPELVEVKINECEISEEAKSPALYALAGLGQRSFPPGCWSLPKPTNCYLGTAGINAITKGRWPFLATLELSRNRI
jgi:hypothetical protein